MHADLDVVYILLNLHFANPRHVTIYKKKFQKSI